MSLLPRASDIRRGVQRVGLLLALRVTSSSCTAARWPAPVSSRAGFERVRVRRGRFRVGLAFGLVIGELVEDRGVDALGRFAEGARHLQRHGRVGW